MEHKVFITVELTVEAPDTTTIKEVECAAYWFMHSSIESYLNCPIENGSSIKDFNIKINN